MDKDKSEQVYIETIRRVSASQLTAQDLKNSNTIDAIRRISGGNLHLNTHKMDAIQAEKKLSNAEIGVIEAVRRLSGVNAALGELGVGIVHPQQVALNVKEDKSDKNDKSGLGDKPWHLMSQDDILKELQTRSGGLTAAEHDFRLQKY